MNKEVLLKEFEKLESLNAEDFITIERYGTESDEGSLKGTRNALNHFAWEILKVTLFAKDEYSMDGFIDDDAAVGIHSIEVVERKDAQSMRYKPTFKDRLISFVIKSFVILFMASSFYGFMSFFKRFF